jgi:hypothetical protein
MVFAALVASLRVFLIGTEAEQLLAESLESFADSGVCLTTSAGARGQSGSCMPTDLNFDEHR